MPLKYHVKTNKIDSKSFKTTYVVLCAKVSSNTRNVFYVISSMLTSCEMKMVVVLPFDVACV